MLFRKRTQTAVDVGTWSVKAVVSDGRKLVQSAMTHPLYPERQSMAEEPSEALRLERVVQGMKQAQSTLPGFGPPMQWCSSWDEGTICSFLELPEMSAKELQVAVGAQATRHIPFAMETVSLCYMQVPALSTVRKAGVFFFAQQRAQSDILMKALKAAGLKVSEPGHPVFNLVHEFALNRASSDQCEALIHVGYRSTQIVVLVGRHPYYHREIGLAGRDFTYAFQQAHQSTWEQAETYKGSYHATAREVPIEPFLLRWLEEVKRSLAAYKTKLPGSPEVSSVWLSGGGACMQGLAERLAETLAKPVAVDTPSQTRVEAQRVPEREGPVYKVAIGASIDE